MQAVAIMVGDDGKVTVGAMPKEMMAEMMGGEEPGEGGMRGMGGIAGGGAGNMGGMGEGGGMGNMQPAQDVDSALAIAKELLTSGQPDQSQTGPAMAPGGGRMMGKMTPQDMAWNKVTADRKAMA